MKEVLYKQGTAEARAAVPVLKERYRLNLRQAYSQGKELKSIPWPFRPESTGMCQSLCFTWIRKRYAGTDPVSTHWWKTREYNTNQDAYKKVREEQRVSVGPREALDVMKQRDKKLRPLHMGGEQGHMASPPYPTAARWDLGRAQFAENVRISLTGGGPGPMCWAVGLSGGGGAHALALARRDDGFYCFDPNLGEYRFDSAENASEFMADLYRDVYAPRGLDATQIFPVRHGPA
ncbi:YopT-type cysteine protease domain-containing protein [Nannocystis punicea]|uniref:YopT-type cysteine protease domain-containing protein n=1 Tax=Nannocystis punicea TaxID=2995304 RepID=A0ABY7GVP8_9BACT|nr:YopT-type cysteine protease domain-containing protein [Nannocystis poenicansa]WAS91021.1 YopT-type cysteine protease domain-containing protein [Nannocystis poenicansa]